jgi:hypothetical protein
MFMSKHAEKYLYTGSRKSNCFFFSQNVAILDDLVGLILRCQTKVANLCILSRYLNYHTHENNLKNVQLS